MPAGTYKESKKESRDPVIKDLGSDYEADAPIYSRVRSHPSQKQTLFGLEPEDDSDDVNKPNVSSSDKAAPESPANKTPNITGVSKTKGETHGR